MHNSITVANRFLSLAEEDGGALTPMQVLKLVYIAHGWTLGLLGRPLFREEVQAWQYGPVIPDLYKAVRTFRSQPVVGPLRVTGDTDLDADEEGIVAQVYEIYGRRSGPALSRLTHAADSPWAQVYESGSFGKVIPNDLIEDHYARLASVEVD